MIAALVVFVIFYFIHGSLDGFWLICLPLARKNKRSPKNSANNAPDDCKIIGTSGTTISEKQIVATSITATNIKPTPAILFFMVVPSIFLYLIFA